MVFVNINPRSVDKKIKNQAPLRRDELESDEPPLESDLHRDNIDLLIRLLKYWWSDRPDFYISGNLTIYYNEERLKSKDLRGPDVFVVLDAEKRDRKSWAIWDEGGKFPNLVIELLSDSTASVDRRLKKNLYQDVWQLPNYFWFHPHTLEFAGFCLVGGKYQAIAPTKSGLLWSDQLGLYLGIYDRKLRWFTADEKVMPLPEDQALQDKEQALRDKEQALRDLEQERLAKDKALQKAERLLEILRSQGIDPDQIIE